MQNQTLKPQNKFYPRALFPERIVSSWSTDSLSRRTFTIYSFWMLTFQACPLIGTSNLLEGLLLLLMNRNNPISWNCITTSWNRLYYVYDLIVYFLTWMSIMRYDFRWRQELIHACEKPDKFSTIIANAVRV